MVTVLPALLKVAISSFTGNAEIAIKAIKKIIMAMMNQKIIKTAEIMTTNKNFRKASLFNQKNWEFSTIFQIFKQLLSKF